MITNRIKILEELAVNPIFIEFAEMLREEVETEMINKILSGNVPNEVDIARVKIYHNLKEYPKKMAEKLKKDKEITERNTGKGVYKE